MWRSLGWREGSKLCFLSWYYPVSLPRLPEWLIRIWESWLQDRPGEQGTGLHPAGRDEPRPTMLEHVLGRPKPIYWWGEALSFRCLTPAKSLLWILTSFRSKILCQNVLLKPFLKLSSQVSFYPAPCSDPLVTPSFQGLPAAYAVLEVHGLLEGPSIHAPAFRKPISGS